MIATIKDYLIEPCYLIEGEQSENCLNTIFGVAKINTRGYFQITTRKKGFHRKLLHRLIVEYFYQITLPSNWEVHHFNRNKLDNRIHNLHILPHGKHHRFHSDEQIGKSPCDSTKLKQSYLKNTSGYFRVKKQNDPTCKQGFIWHYRYYDENNKRKVIASTDLKRLKQKVLSKGLLWCKL